MKLLPLLVWLGATSLAPMAQDPEPKAAAKARLESALRAADLQFETTPSQQSFALQFDFAGGRRQRVLVSATPGTAADLAVHAIYTTVWTGQEPPSAELVRTLCSRSKKFGGFYVFRDSKGVWALRFGAQFDATDLPATVGKGSPAATALRDLIEFVATVGDETVAELAKAK